MKTKLKNGPREAREGVEPDGQMTKEAHFHAVKIQKWNRDGFG